jgi:DnaJ-class molecular chaperone|tara:strand:+ start:138 stop:299 length:162 start_codon:yes stop_codon:yes gene_type:complete
MDMGNGKCDECRGTGLGDGFDQFTSNLVNEKSKCKKCYGSGKCQTCKGKGIID